MAVEITTKPKVQLTNDITEQTADVTQQNPDTNITPNTINDSLGVKDSNGGKQKSISGVYLGANAGDKGFAELGTSGKENKILTPETPQVFTDVTAASKLPIANSWEEKGAQKAQTQYEIDVNSAKQNVQQNAISLKQNSTEYQKQADMMQYQNNQSAEKVGWTGGYVLDLNRQMAYLKESLGTEMYGAVALQEAGLKTSLAAARLSYDLNLQEFAEKYYQDAVTNALNEAQITGVYISAEIQDMLDQTALAERTLTEEGYKYDATSGKWLRDGQEPTDSKDYRLIQKVNSWFRENNITEVGQKTLAKIQQEQANNLSWHTQLWTEYNAALQAAKADIDDNPTVFIRYKDDGTIDYTGTTNQDDPTIESEVKTIDMSGLTVKDLKDYAKSDKQKEQIVSYYTWRANQIIATNKQTSEDGKTTTSIDKETITKKLQDLSKELQDIIPGATMQIDGWDTTSETFNPTGSDANADYSSAQYYIDDEGNVQITSTGKAYNAKITPLSDFTGLAFTGDSFNEKVSYDGKEYKVLTLSGLKVENNGWWYANNKNVSKEIKQEFAAVKSAFPNATSGDVVKCNSHIFIFEQGYWNMINTESTDTESGYREGTNDLYNALNKLALPELKVTNKPKTEEAEIQTQTNNLEEDKTIANNYGNVAINKSTTNGITSESVNLKDTTYQIKRPADIYFINQGDDTNWLGSPKYNIVTKIEGTNLGYMPNGDVVIQHNSEWWQVTGLKRNDLLS